jgi:hypothetical protein
MPPGAWLEFQDGAEPLVILQQSTWNQAVADFCLARSDLHGRAKAVYGIGTDKRIGADTDVDYAKWTTKAAR